MPSNSKQKKHSKSQSKLPSTPQSAAASTPRTPSKPDEAELASLCVEASRRFPSFIGASAFAGEIVGVENDPNSNGSKIWLSEPSMVAYSLSPGSIVSVSIASSMDRNEQLDSFPLQSLANECVRCYRLENGKMSDDGDAGNYFMLAKVFPSTKVLKNGVRLPLNISYSMGSPPLGSIVFVYPVQKHYLSGLANGSNELHSTENNCLSICDCNELYLQLAPCKNGFQLEINDSPSLDLPAAKSRVQSENDIVASPRTPYNGSKFSNAIGLSSPIFEDSASRLPIQNSQSMASFNVIEALGDESARKLIQACATSWLYSRYLLLGNHVSVPIFSEMCIFQVIGAKKVAVGRSGHYSSNGGSSLHSEDFDIAVKLNQGIVINRETKVFLEVPKVNWEDVGGQKEIKAQLMEAVEWPQKHHDASNRIGTHPPTGVLLFRPPGCSKTLMAQVVASEAGLNFLTVKGPELFSKWVGESEKAVRSLFAKGRANAPSIVFFDEIDGLAVTRGKESDGVSVSDRVMSQLLVELDG